jgi:hypothetical protein
MDARSGYFNFRALSASERQINQLKITNYKSQITTQQYNNGDDGDDGTTADRLLLVALANAHTPASNARVSTVERCY